MKNNRGQAKPAPMKTSKINPKPQKATFRPGAWTAAAIAFVAYLPVLGNGFVNWDDEATILNNPNLAQPLGDAFRSIFDIVQGSAGLGNYNPLSIFSFYLEKILAGGFNSTMIHFDNILLHALAVFFVVRVLTALGVGTGGAFVGGLLFGIHPMRVESVAWATERKDVLFAVFFFAALWYYIRSIKAAGAGQGGRRFYVIAILLAFLSCLSKVQAVALPLSMLAVDYWLRRPFTLKSVLLEKAPFWILALVFGLINVYTLGLQGATDDSLTNFTLADRLCIGTWSFCVYLYKLVLPFPMLPLYVYPTKLPVWVYASALLFAGIAYLVWRLHLAGRRMWVFGFLFFFFNIMFLLQVQPAGQGYLADRFTYVAYFGFFAVTAWLYDQRAQNETRSSQWKTGLGILTVAYVAMTYFQISIWKNSETLWSHVIKHSAVKSGRPYWYRGQYYRGEQLYEASLNDYRSALALEPKNAELINSRGKTCFDMAMSGKYPPALSADYLRQSLDDYNSSLQLADNRVRPKARGAMLINRGAALGTINRLDQAMQDFNEGLNLDPGNKTGYLNRGTLYLKLQQPAEALKDYNKYLELDPGNVRIVQERDKLRRRLQ